MTMPGFPIRVENTLEDWIVIDGKWHHLAVIVGPHPRVYVDGTDAHPQDCIAVYDRALTPDEIGEHFRVATPDAGTGA